MIAIYDATVTWRVNVTLHYEQRREDMATHLQHRFVNDSHIPDRTCISFYRVRDRFFRSIESIFSPYVI